jgi:hypothetical protein
MLGTGQSAQGAERLSSAGAGRRLCAYMPITSDDSAQEPGAAAQARAADAAEAAADADRLLPGEEEAHSTAEDAALWVDVYSELLAFKQKMVADTDAQLTTMNHEEARREVERTDAIVLRAEAERLARRLGFWRRRFQDLSRS